MSLLVMAIFCGPVEEGQQKVLFTFLFRMVIARLTLRKLRRRSFGAHLVLRNVCPLMRCPHLFMRAWCPFSAKVFLGVRNHFCLFFTIGRRQDNVVVELLFAP